MPIKLVSFFGVKLGYWQVFVFLAYFCKEKNQKTTKIATFSKKNGILFTFFLLESKNDKVRKSTNSMASLKQCLPINSLYCNPICIYITSFVLATRWQEHANSITGFSLCLSTVHSVKEIHLAETQKTESNLLSPISGEVAKSM